MFAALEELEESRTFAGGGSVALFRFLLLLLLLLPLLLLPCSTPPPLTPLPAGPLRPSRSIVLPLPPLSGCSNGQTMFGQLPVCFHILQTPRRGAAEVPWSLSRGAAAAAADKEADADEPPARGGGG